MRPTQPLKGPSQRQLRVGAGVKTVLGLLLFLIPQAAVASGGAIMPKPLQGIWALSDRSSCEVYAKGEDSADIIKISADLIQVWEGGYSLAKVRVLGPSRWRLDLLASNSENEQTKVSWTTLLRAGGVLAAQTEQGLWTLHRCPGGPRPEGRLPSRDAVSDRLGTT